MKSANQICRKKRKEKVKAQSKKIEWQKKDIKNLKAASIQMDPRKLIEAMTQTMKYMYNMQKDPNKKLTCMKPLCGKPYLGKSKQPQTTKGLDGTADTKRL